MSVLWKITIAVVASFAAIALLVLVSAVLYDDGDEVADVELLIGYPATPIATPIATWTEP